MTGKHFLLFSAAAVALAACGQKVDTTNTTMNASLADGSNMADVNDMMAANSAAPLPTGAQAFVNTAAASDAFEIAASKLALDTSKTASVKTFAQKMITAHTGSTAKLKGIVAKLNPPLTPDATLSAEQQTMLDGLKGKTGADFDTAFAQAQVTAHQATLDALKGYAATGDVAELKTFATGLEPTVADHLKMAQELK